MTVTVRATSLRAGDVVIHATTGQRLDVVQTAWVNKKLVLRDEAGAIHAVPVDYDQTVIIERGKR